jgi:hypothetical protein
MVGFRQPILTETPDRVQRNQSSVKNSNFGLD